MSVGVSVGVGVGGWTCWPWLRSPNEGTKQTGTRPSRARAFPRHVMVLHPRAARPHNASGATVAGSVSNS